MDLQKILDTKLHFFSDEGQSFRTPLTLGELLRLKRSKAHLAVRSPELLDCLQGYVIAAGSGIVVKQLKKPYLKNLAGCYTLLGEVS